MLISKYCCLQKLLFNGFLTTLVTSSLQLCRQCKKRKQMKIRQKLKKENQNSSENLRFRQLKTQEKWIQDRIFRQIMAFLIQAH